MHNGEYCIGYNYLKATEKFREDGFEPITLAIHGTSEMMETIEKKPSNWDGPISVALFIDFHSRQALQYLAYVHRCHEEFRKKVTVHYAFRISPSQSQCAPMKDPVFNETCQNFLENQRKYRESIDGPFQLYPINLMRNIARKGAKSDLHLIIDADMVMSERFAIKVKQIANRMIDGKNKKLLVVRRFETNENSIPRNHVQLKEDVKNNKVFEFHHKFFFVGHRIPNISEWFDKSTQSDNVTAWEIPYSGNQWEVQVILHRNDLYNPDYFPSRIRDMQSLIYSLCRANYTFHLLSHVFNVHDGIKLDDTMYSKVVAGYSKKYSRTRAYNRYFKEINKAYPETIQKCGAFFM